MTTVLDISKHQNKMDFKLALSRGIKGVMLRASYGSSKDTRFDSFARAAADEGLSVGAYFFATWHYDSVSPNFETAKKNAESQTKTALSFLEGKKITAPVAVDLELEKTAVMKFSKAELTELTKIALETIKKAGYTPMLYCSVSWLYDRLDKELLNCPLWVAYYFKGAKKDSFPDTKYGRLLEKLSGNLALWQHSSEGDGKYFGAASERVDENFCYNEKLFGFGCNATSSAPETNEKKSLYTVKIKTGSWYVRKLYSTASTPIKIINGGVQLQASQKKNGWYYLTVHKGWIGPAAVESSFYNNTKTATHKVTKGDTLTKIAAKHGKTVDEIVTLNKKNYPKITRDYIQTGWILKV